MIMVKLYFNMYSNRSFVGYCFGIVFIMLALILALSSTVVGSNEQVYTIEQIQAIVSRPSYEQLQAIGNFRTEELIRVLESDKRLDAKQGAVWAMAYQKDARGGPVLRELLTHDYGGQALSQDEEKTLVNVVLVIGFLAGRDQESFNFLAERVDPASWLKTKTWSSVSGDYATDLLTSFTIQALGISGREEAQELLSELNQGSPNYLHRFAGDTTQAQFYLHLRERYGEEGLLKYMTDSDDTKAEFNRWIENEGRRAFDWANDKMKGPLPSNNAILIDGKKVDTPIDLKIASLSSDTFTYPSLRHRKCKASDFELTLYSNGEWKATGKRHCLANLALPKCRDCEIGFVLYGDICEAGEAVAAIKIHKGNMSRNEALGVDEVGDDHRIKDNYPVHCKPQLYISGCSASR